MADNGNKCECVNRNIWELRSLMIQDFERAQKKDETPRSVKFTENEQSANVYKIYGDYGYGSYEIDPSFPSFHNPFYYKDFYDPFSNNPQKYTVQITERSTNWTEFINKGIQLILIVKENGIDGKIVAETDGTFISGDESIIQSAKFAICLR